MFAVKYYYDFGQHCDYKIFETVGDALKWWTGNKRLKEQASFYDRLYVLPPGLEDPIKWCKDNIKDVACPKNMVYNGSRIKKTGGL